MKSGTNRLYEALAYCSSSISFSVGPEKVIIWPTLYGITCTDRTAVHNLYWAATRQRPFNVVQYHCSQRFEIANMVVTYWYKHYNYFGDSTDQVDDLKTRAASSNCHGKLNQFHESLADSNLKTSFLQPGSGKKKLGKENPGPCIRT